MSTIPGASGVNVTLSPAVSPTVVQQANAVIQSALTGTVTVTGAGSPTAPGGANQLAVATNNPLNLNVNATSAYRFFVVGDTSAAVTVTGAAAANQVVVLGTDVPSVMTFVTGGGSGLILTGDGAKSINTGTGNSFGVYTGTGNDTVSMVASLAGGRSTVAAGPGGNTVALGAGSTQVVSTGSDTIGVGTGSTTVQAIGAASVSVSGGSGPRTVVSGSGSATVAGGAGSATVTGGSGGGQFYGGSAGNNLLIGGSGNTYLTGSGTGDVLIATSAGTTQVLLAGAGNETLLGSLSSADNIFEAGPGSDLIVAGAGSDTIYAGSGAVTATGGAGFNVYLFNPVIGSGGSVTITDFKPGADLVHLVNYGDKPAALVAASTHPTPTSTQVVLADGTSITFLGIGALPTSAFG